MKYGIQLPQVRMQLGGIKDDAQAYEMMTRVAQTADECGYETVWLSDHFHYTCLPLVTLPLRKRGVCRYRALSLCSVLTGISSLTVPAQEYNRRTVPGDTTCPRSKYSWIQSILPSFTWHTRQILISTFVPAGGRLLAEGHCSVTMARWAYSMPIWSSLLNAFVKSM